MKGSGRLDQHLWSLDEPAQGRYYYRMTLAEVGRSLSDPE